ncbi:DJ-1/PfpI family protein [Allostreptomyces psammosilenae]|uniref:Transcriptional regulator GlxA family with amidase domain n=1 Tax=Allostreptomyces psammosilenae TaxID=1892865 RepID=A0A853A458_9ACTN|nr:DJ-1/PfpI family protein [Allostreptomyces psammosilenae]NYI08250.1 transcriptional regulator GlxA family with amidase domain [Allostreptomyces psammosilenae]
MRRRNLIRTSLAAATGAVTATTALAPGAAHADAARAAAAPAAGDAARRRTVRIQLVMFEGVEELDFMASVEVFGLARALGADLSCTLVAAHETGTVTAGWGTPIVVERAWSPRDADVMIVAGGGYRTAEQPGVRREIERGVLPAKLAAAVRPGLVVVGVCTGVMLLSAAGITRGRPCTTHHRAVEDLRAQGGLVRPGRVVDDGDLVTAGGVTSGLDLSLWLVERHFGAELAVEVEEILEYERRGTVWRPAR